MLQMHNGLMWGAHWIWWTLLIIILIGVFLVFQNILNKPVKEVTPLDILKRRFAAGEIDEKEFEQRKKALNKV